jgi:uncharacterized protein involved in exopolysaccharide biosynthesis
MAPESPQQFPDDPGTAEARERWDDEATVDLGRYVRAVRHRWKLVIAGAVLGGAIAFAYASRQGVVYDGVTTLLVVPRTLPSGVQINPATFSAIVKNLTLASQVIQELKLQDEFTPQAFAASAIDIESVPATSVVKIKVRLEDPKMAAEASRLLAQKAIKLTQQVTEQQGASTEEQLKSSLNDASDRLQKAEQDLLAYEQRNQVELLRQDANVLLKQRGDLMQLGVDLGVEQARLAAAEQEIARQPPLLARSRPPAVGGTPGQAPPAPGSGDEPRPPDASVPVVNPTYQTLATLIATSRTRIAALEKERDELTNGSKVGGRNLAQLSELYRRQSEQARLQTRFDLAKRVHDDVALRYEQSRTEPVTDVTPLQILDDALPPDAPVSRKRLQYTAFGATAGFVGAAVVAILWQGRGRRRPRA